MNFIQQFEERFMYKNSLSFKNEINHFVMFITTNPRESPVVKTNDDTAEKLCLQNHLSKLSNSMLCMYTNVFFLRKKLPKLFL